MCYEGINALGLGSFTKSQVYLPGILTSLMLLGNYPMTQVYQHEEDAKRGDKTLSLLLGIKGTFVFTAIVFTFATAGFGWFFNTFYKISYAIEFLIFLTPVLAYFLYWFYLVNKNTANATYGRTMWLNFISALCLNAFFIYLFLDSSQVIQAIRGGF